MADKCEVAISMAMLQRAKDFADSQSLTIAFPNITFTPPSANPTAKWLRATLLPNDSFALSINQDGPNQYYGILQLDIFYGQEAGIVAPMRIAADAASYFKFGTTMTRDGFSVTVMDVPRVREGLRDDPWVMVSVRIPYRSLSVNP